MTPPTTGSLLTLGEAQRILPAANAELARLGEQVVDEYLVDGAQGPIAPRVRMEVIGLLASGDLGKDKVARRLGLGARTLQRRLDAEGLTFRELVDATRRGLAERYVREGRLPIKEIAYMLGFSEPQQFHAPSANGSACRPGRSGKPPGEPTRRRRGLRRPARPSRCSRTAGGTSARRR